MKRYNKGANAERELISRLYDYGFAIARVAGSGSTPLPCPDIIAMKNSKAFAFECKAWNSMHLSLSKQQMEELLEWSEIAGSQLFIAWKIPKEGWLFISPSHFNKNLKNYCISKKTAKLKSKELECILGLQNTLALNRK